MLKETHSSKTVSKGPFRTRVSDQALEVYQKEVFIKKEVAFARIRTPDTAGQKAQTDLVSVLPKPRLQEILLCL